MLTKFEGIPRPFVDLYRRELEHWARNFRRRGPLQRVELRYARPDEIEMNPDPIQGPVRKFVTLYAEHQTHVITGDERMIIRPHTDEDREKITRHIVEMRHVVPLQ